MKTIMVKAFLKNQRIQIQDQKKIARMLTVFG